MTEVWAAKDVKAGGARSVATATGNLSKAKRERLVAEMGAIRAFLEKSAGTDTNAVRLLEFAAEVEKEVRGKKYGLVFEEHRERVDVELDENLPVLTEVKGRFLAAKCVATVPSPSERKHDGVGAVATQTPPLNFLIEGDNLAALKLLEKTHRGKIDLIYIDPPYNTGNKDFIYNDSYVDKTDTFRHSKWLSFMQKRLDIAKRLMSDKGVIFISIDDNEQAALKLLCDDVFGADAFVATIPWRKRTAKADVPFKFSQDYEWVVCYARPKFNAGIRKETRKYYETADFPGRPWRIHDLTKQTSAEERPNSFFTIVNPKDGRRYRASAKRTWAITQETFEKYYAEGRVVFPGDYEFLNIQKPVLRYFKDDDERKAGERFGYTTASTYLPKEVGMTQDGTKDIDEIFGEKAFSFPKPVSLIAYLLKIAVPNDAPKVTILDFFAGSGTTGHAVMKLNAEDGGKRKFILVTNNENGICEKVTYERLKRVIEKEGYAAALKYFRIDYVPFGEDGYWDLADKLLGHIRELVEIENGIDFAHDKSVAIVLTDEELAKFAAKLGERSRGTRDPTSGRGTTALPNVLYKGHNVMLGGKVKSALAKSGIEVRTIPDYYYPELEGER